MTYVINIVTCTKSTDIYDEVAVNKWPIVFQYESLDELFSDREFIDYCRDTVKSQNLYEHAKMNIRCLDDESKQTIALKEKIKLEYE